jgi:type IV secretory pathway VirJ component
MTEELPATVSALISRLQTVGAKVDVTHFPPTTRRGAILLALVQPHLGSQAPDEEDVSDLPLVELRAKTASNMLAIVLSGDGGWRDLDQTIGHDLQGWGVSVIGFDSLRYFWSQKTPDQTAHDLARVILTYTKRWKAHSVALIGYSFGADVLPFAYNRLPPKARAKVQIISLLGFAGAADFEIRVLGWLGLPPSSQALPERPEMAKIPPNLVQCFYGQDETDTLCPELAKTGVTVIRTSGGHHFGGDYEGVAHTILSDWRRRMMMGYATADYRGSQVAARTAAMRHNP